ncbi:hypothetical protein T4D_10081, partial [Trichinella pseudospiralis]
LFIAILSFKQMHEMLKKNILATSSAPHYFDFYCRFNIKAYSLYSSVLKLLFRRFHYSSHCSVLFICTQQGIEDLKILQVFVMGWNVKVMWYVAVKTNDVFISFVILVAQIIYMDITPPNRMR